MRNVTYTTPQKPPLTGRELFVYRDGAGWTLLEVSSNGSAAEVVSRKLKRTCLRAAWRLAQDGARVTISITDLEQLGSDIDRGWPQ